MILSIGRYFCPTLQHTPIITPGIHKESHIGGGHLVPMAVPCTCWYMCVWKENMLHLSTMSESACMMFLGSWRYLGSHFSTTLHHLPPSFTATHHSLHHLLERNGIELICTGSEYFSLCNNTIAALPPMLRDVVTPLSRRTIALHTKLATKPTQDE